PSKGIIEKSVFQSELNLFSGDIFSKAEIGRNNETVFYNNVDLLINDSCFDEVCSGTTQEFSYFFRADKAEDIVLRNTKVGGGEIYNSNIQNVTVDALVRNINVNGLGGRITGSLVANSGFNMTGLIEVTGDIEFSNVNVNADRLSVNNSSNAPAIKIIEGSILGEAGIGSSDGLSVISNIELDGENSIVLSGDNEISSLVLSESDVTIERSEVSNFTIDGGSVRVAESKVEDLEVSSSIFEATSESNVRDVKVLDSSIFIVNNSNVTETNVINLSDIEFTNEVTSLVMTFNESEGEQTESSDLSDSFITRTNLSGFCEVRNNSNITDSEIEGRGNCVIDNSQVFGNSFVEGRVLNSTVRNKGRALASSTVQSGAIIDDSIISGEAIVSGANIVESIINGTANITSNKFKNQCDGINDNDPEDFCIKEVE
ncbi:hypothetical protein OAT67_08120, partial [Bacteriovoracaceae bacterium]|nr:hypothetical protein [Bacteriovoracaceae bacterium]